MAKARTPSARTKSRPAAKKATAKKATAKKAPAKKATAKKAAAPRRRVAARAREAEVLLTLSPITDAERAAFEGQFTEAECDLRGEGADAARVLGEAATAVDAMAPAVLAGALRYNATRLRHLLDLLGDLKTHLDDARRGAVAELDDAMQEASVVREELQNTLGLIVRGDARGTEALAVARSHESMAASLKTLAECARHWLDRADETARTLVAAHGLRQADVDASLRAARRLDRALTAARTGSALSRDLPPLARLVGRVVLEVEVLALASEKAHEDNPVVPEIPIGTAIRAAAR